MRCWGIYDTNILAYKQRPALKEPLAEEMTRHGFDLSQYELKGHPIRWFSPFNQFAVPASSSSATRPAQMKSSVKASHHVGIWPDRGPIDSGCNRSKRFFISRLSPSNSIQLARSSPDHPYRHHPYSVPSALGLVPKVLLALFKPVVVVAAWLFVLNWGKRMK